jgi:hypothetical protein
MPRRIPSSAHHADDDRTVDAARYLRPPASGASALEGEVQNVPRETDSRRLTLGCYAPHAISEDLAAGVLGRPDHYRPSSHPRGEVAFRVMILRAGPSCPSRSTPAARPTGRSLDSRKVGEPTFPFGPQSSWAPPHCGNWTWMQSSIWSLLWTGNARLA